MLAPLCSPRMAGFARGARGGEPPGSRRGLGTEEFAPGGLPLAQRQVGGEWEGRAWIQEDSSMRIHWCKKKSDSDPT